MPQESKYREDVWDDLEVGDDVSDVISEPDQAEIVSLCGKDGFQLFKPRRLPEPLAEEYPH